MDISKFTQLFNIWYYLVYMMEGFESYPQTLQTASWAYLDGNSVHPNILINARPLYVEEVKSSFEEARN